MGFCLMGNAAIAARYAQRRHGLKRVLIFDFDVHHGNGTQTVFDADPSVLFISTHMNSEPGCGSGTPAVAGTAAAAALLLLLRWPSVSPMCFRRCPPNVLSCPFGPSLCRRLPLQWRRQGDGGGGGAGRHRQPAPAGQRRCAAFVD